MKLQQPGTYDTAFAEDNRHGHALRLLGRHRRQDADGKIHLDIGCGYGRLAEPLRQQLGLSYVGLDADDSGLSSLRSRGFEAHKAVLTDEDATLDVLRQCVGDRQIASITMLDTLEHLLDGQAVLKAVSRLAQAHAAFVVISVPNITHTDIGFRLAFGRWDYTKTGLLDHTHLRQYSGEILHRDLAGAGLFAIDHDDVCTLRSDQHFPVTHPALATGTELRSYLSSLRDSVDAHGAVTQFVRLCVPGPALSVAPYVLPDHDQGRPFLSIILRTQGRRPHSLMDVFTALAGQTDTDFETLVIGHDLSQEGRLAVQRAIDDNPEWLRQRCRLVPVQGGNRTRPLNVGFAAAEGRYIAILDDDDLPFGHWVERFHALADRSPGRLLRSVAVRQDAGVVTVGDVPGVRALGGLEKIFPASFDFLDHLRVNQTPPVALAFPRGVFHDLGLQFDETLTTTEDWDYIMRVAAVVGTACDPEITAIYRWWREDESSRTVHSRDEWHRNHLAVQQKMDQAPVLLPAGTTQRIRALLECCDGRCGGAHGEGADRLRQERLREVVSILLSTSWRIAAPVRWLARLTGRPSTRHDDIWQCSAEELTRVVQTLRRSTSWRVTAPLRRLRGV